MSKDLFSSKPEQIAKSALKITETIFGTKNKIEIIFLGYNEINDYLMSFFKKKTQQFSIESKNLSEEDTNFSSFFFKDILIIASTVKTITFEKSVIVNFLKKRKQKPLLLIDTSVPRIIDEDVRVIDNCFLYDLNDLEQFFSENYNYFSKNFNLEEEFNDLMDEYLPFFLERLALDDDKKYYLENKIKKFFYNDSATQTEKNAIINLLKFLLKD